MYLFIKNANERDDDMFKSNLTNQLLKIIGIWTIYLIIFTNDTFSYSPNKIIFISATLFYILLTMFFLWRIKNPGKNVRSNEKGF